MCFEFTFIYNDSYHFVNIWGLFDLYDNVEIMTSLD